VGSIPTRPTSQKLGKFGSFTSLGSTRKRLDVSGSYPEVSEFETHRSHQRRKKGE
jgi:hypothetical protein